MNARSLLGATALLSMLSAGAALAQTAGSPSSAVVDTDLKEVVVTATRSPTRLDKIGASISVIDEKAIIAKQVVVATDLLVETPGVSFARTGGVGKATSLYIRGAETDQTVVLIDGVKLNDPSAAGGGYNAGDLLSGDIARMEVLRGAQSTLWGSQAIGGVVNIITRQPAKRFEVDGSAEGGSFHTAYGKLGAGGRTDRLLWRGSVGYYTTDGVSAFAKENGGVETDGYRNVGANGRAVLKITGDLSVEGRAVYSKGHNEFDSTAGDAPSTGDTTTWVAYAGVNLDLFDKRLKNRIGYAYTDTDRVNENPLQAVTPVTFAAAGKNRRLEYQGNFLITEGWTVTFGAERERSQMRTASPSAAAPNPRPSTGKTGIDGYYAQLQAEVIPGLTVTGGVRRDEHMTFGRQTLGQLQAAWSFNDGGTVFRASYGEGFKAPSLYQLYSDFGNTALDPERAKAWDVGVEHHFVSNLVGSFTYFERHTTNLIEFVSCTAVNRNDPVCVGRTGFYNNVSRAMASGVELGASYSLGALTLNANYTYLHAVNDTPGSANFKKDLARRPHAQSNLSANYLWPFKLSTGLSVRKTAYSWNNAANTQRLKGYTLVDVRASYPVTDHIELYGRIENLFEQTYQTTLTYGSPPRGAYAGVRARF